MKAQKCGAGDRNIALSGQLSFTGYENDYYKQIATRNGWEPPSVTVGWRIVGVHWGLMTLKTGIAWWYDDFIIVLGNYMRL